MLRLCKNQLVVVGMDPNLILTQDCAYDAGEVTYSMSNREIRTEGRELDLPETEGLPFDFGPEPPQMVPMEQDGSDAEQYQISDDVVMDIFGGGGGGGGSDEEEEEEDDDDAIRGSGCFLCDWGERRYDKIMAPKVDRLNQILQEGFGNISTEALSHALASYYQSEIRRPALYRGERLPVWRPKDVEKHITEHMTGNPSVWLMLTIKRLQFYELWLDKQLKQDAASGDRIGAFQCMRLSLQVNRRLELLNQMDPKNMWGYNENGFKFDPRMMGQFVHLTRVRVGAPPNN